MQAFCLKSDLSDNIYIACKLLIQENCHSSSTRRSK